jgi:hypothetical protein
MMHKILCGLLFLGATLGLVAPASAQVLIWSLPKDDGSWIRFEGTYRQTTTRPDAAAGDLTVEWRSELTISAVGAENAEYRGAMTKCRWIEFKSITKPNGLEKPPGPGGTYLYKVLIPEAMVTGKTVDADNIPVTFLPIIKGFRKVGERDVQPVAEQALAVYPMIAPVTSYPNLKPEGDAPQNLPLQFSEQPVSARTHKGSRVIQDAMTRSTNAATLWLADEVPFGLARFQVNLVREGKQTTEPVEAFKRISLTEVEMTAVARGNDARSEIAGN